MKKTILLASIIGLSSLLLTGCGESKPSDVAIEFVEAFTKAEIKESKALSSEDLDRNFKKVSKSCNRLKFQEYNKDMKSFLKEMETVINENQSKKTEIDKRSKEFKKVIANINKDDRVVATMWTTKYGSVRKAPKDVREEYLKNYYKIMFDATNKFMKSQMDFVGVNSDRIGFEILVQLMANKSSGKRSYSPVDEAINNVLERNPAKITPTCINKSSKFGFVESINLIESKEVSPDKTEVRLELIKKDGSSKKRTIEVEKIKGEWKVSNI